MCVHEILAACNVGSLSVWFSATPTQRNAGQRRVGQTRGGVGVYVCQCHFLSWFPLSLVPELAGEVVWVGVSVCVKKQRAACISPIDRDRAVAVAVAVRYTLGGGQGEGLV